MAAGTTSECSWRYSGERCGVQLEPVAVAERLQQRADAVRVARGRADAVDDASELVELALRGRGVVRQVPESAPVDQFD